MCGFVGYIVDQPKILSTEEMNSFYHMTNLITHRGPDDHGYYTDQYVRFGFRRLSIIDVEGGKQPLSFENDRYWIIFNGEIYNHIELRDELMQQGIEFKTSSDTEVIIALYSLYKEDLLHKLRGMFAFVIWDKQEKELFAARDPFGIKPLFYGEHNGRLYLASEKKSILDEDKINKEALQHYFSFQYIVEPSTITDSIKKLEPGHFIIKKMNKPVQIQKYWEPTFSPTLHSSIDEQIKKVQEVLRESVHIHMRSDVPVGSFLSGGIDSSSVVALAKEVHPNIKTFTVGFEREGYSEIDVAKETAEKLGVENIHYVITPDEFMKNLPKIIWHMDEPVADPAAIPLFFVAREASKHVKVVLSGEGADELFAGYNIYREPQALRWFNFLPSQMKKLLKLVAQQLPDGTKGKSYIIRGCTPLEERYIGNAKIFNEQEKSLFLKNYHHNVHYSQVTKRFYEKVKQYHDVQKMQYIDICTWLRGDILVKADKMTMANSLELRVPFLDREVFDVAQTLDPKANISNGTTKYILRKAMEGIVPNSVLYRKKLGFPVPIKHWLKNELYDWAYTTFSQSQTDHLFDKTYVFKLLEQHRKGEYDHSRKLWTILVFMVWHQVYVEDVYTTQQMEKGHQHRVSGS